MKKLLILFVFSLSLACNAQVTSQVMGNFNESGKTARDSIYQAKAIKIDCGDYLHKAASSMTLSILSAALSGLCIIKASTIPLETKTVNKTVTTEVSSRAKGTYIAGAIFGVVSLACFISIPVNLEQAAKAYKRDKNN